MGPVPIPHLMTLGSFPFTFSLCPLPLGVGEALNGLYGEVVMCESHAYVVRDGEEEKLLDDVTFLKPEGDRIVLRNLFGDEVTVKGKIEEIQFMDHKILLKETA